MSENNACKEAEVDKRKPDRHPRDQGNHASVAITVSGSGM